MTHKTEVNIIIPNMEDLYCINCKVNPVDMQDSIIKSLFHCQILTCRLIIYTVRCCIASPSIKNVGDQIHVIVSKKFYFTGKLQDHLQKLKIYFTEPEPVYRKIYEACLKNTITFKLAPLWNLVGKSFYLRGHNFLSLPFNLDALEWNIKIKANNTTLEIKPMKINLSPLSLEFLSLPLTLLDNFTQNFTTNSINLLLFQCPPVYVLPKLTKAKVVSVSKTLPKSCPFENYNDFRRHWKNMYSYRLPKTIQGTLFYEVVFPTNPNQMFTYPEMCVLRKMPDFLMCENKDKIASDFIKDLTTNVRSICNETIKIGNLYPELNIEYTCVLKKKNSNFTEQNDELKSSFFQCSDYIIKSPNEKPDLSNLDAIPEFNNMSIAMKDHTQQILSIIGNKKRKKRKKNNDQFIAPLTFNDEKLKFNKKYNELPEYTVREVQQQTIIDNIDDIISFYDIPSMNTKHPDSYDYLLQNEVHSIYKENNSESNFKNFSNIDIENKSHSNQLTKQKPIIKNIQNVAYDLNAFKKNNMHHQSNNSNTNFNKNSKQFIQNVNVEENSHISLWNSNINEKRSSQDEKRFQHLKTEQINQNCDNIDPHNNKKCPDDELGFFLYSDNLSEQLDYISEDCDRFYKYKLQKNKSKSCSNLDSHHREFYLNNISTKEIDDIESKIFNAHHIPFLFVSNKKLQQKLKADEFKDNENCDFLKKLDEKITSLESKKQKLHKNEELNVAPHELEICADINSSHFSPMLDKSLKQINKEYLDKVKFKQSTNININTQEEKTNDELFGNVSQFKFDFNNSFQYVNNQTDYSHNLNSNKNNNSNEVEPLYFKDKLNKLEKNSIQKIENMQIDENIDQQNFTNNRELCFLNESQFSNTTFNFSQSSLNKKLLLENESPLFLLNSNNIRNDVQKSNTFEPMNLSQNEKFPCNEDIESQYSPSIFDVYERGSTQLLLESKEQIENLKKNSFIDEKENECKTPSISLFNSNDIVDMQKSPTISPTLFDSYKEGQNTKCSEKLELNENMIYHNKEKDILSESIKENDNSDFMSILSQSSNESESDKYESYKQAYTEALTFH